MMPTPTRKSRVGGIIALLCIIASTTTDAFVVKGAATTGRAAGSFAPALTSSVLTRTALPNILNDAAILAPPSLTVADATEAATNVFIGIGGIVAVLAGVVFVLTSFVIPKAAEQIEVQCKELDPALWQEYARKLEPGEVLAMRPDLMQELGNKIQALQLAKFDELQEQAKRPPPPPPPPQTPADSPNGKSQKPPPPGDVVDVEITSKSWED